MKKIYQLLLASSVVCCAPIITNAQPPDTPAPAEPTVQIPPPHSPRTPEDTVQRFIRESTSVGVYFNDYVEGLDNSYSALPEINRIIKQEVGNFILTAKNISISPNPQNADLATATFILEFSDQTLGLKLAQKDSVELKRHLIPNDKFRGKNEYWAIIPRDPQKYFEANNSSPAKSGVTEGLATLVAYPEDMLPKIHLKQSELQLHQLWLALMMFVQDYDERVEFDHQNYVEKLTPYLKNKELFTAPDMNPGTISYDVNPNILGLTLTASLDYEDTVAFYLGHNQKLDFRYGGKSIVCFLDGHVKAITPEETKDLRWEP